LTIITQSHLNDGTNSMTFRAENTSEHTSVLLDDVVLWFKRSVP
jgi:hypothetical protein